MSENINKTKPLFAWITFIGFLSLIGGLMYCVKSCKQDVIVQNVHTGLKKAENAMDSLSHLAEKDTKALKESLDSITKAFKSSWKALGEYVTIKLTDKQELSIPENGLENKLFAWLKNQKNKIDNTVWFNFDRILFEPGSARLDTLSNEQLRNVARIMKAIPSCEFTIGGYTDNQGKRADNLKLSQQRAETIKKALVEYGIDSNRLEAIGFGDTNPIADNSTEEGRALNRRVSIRVTKK
jgi:OmpA-OmpF porin, OOP family